MANLNEFLTLYDAMCLNIKRFAKKQLIRTWLFAGISPPLHGLRTWSKRQKTQQVLWFALKKQFFAWGCGFFCQWRHKWRTFWPSWPTSPGPGRQPLDGNISLKVLLDSRLPSESFDTSDDLPGFRVQKLW